MDDRLGCRRPTDEPHCTKGESEGVSLGDDAADGASTMPCRMLNVIASRIECAPSLRRMFWTCVRTVARLVPSRSAMALGPSPSLSDRRISISRRVRRSTCAGWLGSRFAASTRLAISSITVACRSGSRR